MERKLINYLPYQVREFKEYQGITTGEQPEFELAWNYWQEVFDNQYIDTAENYGLSRWEKMLGITPKATDSLELRRTRIKARLSLNTPYTIRWLKRWLDEVCGVRNHAENVTDYTFDMQLNYAVIPDADRVANELKKILEDVIPENLGWSFRFLLAMCATTRAGGAFLGIRHERRVPIQPPSLSPPGGRGQARAWGALGGTYRRIVATAKPAGVERPGGRGGTGCAAGVVSTYQRFTVKIN